MVAPQVTNLEPHEFIRGSSQLPVCPPVSFGPDSFVIGRWKSQAAETLSEKSLKTSPSPVERGC